MSTQIVEPAPDEGTLAPNQVRGRLGRVALNRWRLGQIEAERSRPGADLRALNEEIWRLHAETAAILSELGENLGDPTTTVAMGPLLREATIRAADEARLRFINPIEQRITVSDLAAGIGQTVGAARRLLDRDEIPGARRKTPGVTNSPWLIPASAPAAYLVRYTNGKGE